MARCDRSKEEFWRRMIGRQAGSGLSVRAWCGRLDVSEASFYWWRRRLARRGGAGPTTVRRAQPSRARAPQFVPVRITADRAAMPPANADQAHAASDTLCGAPHLQGRRAASADQAHAASGGRTDYIEIILSGDQRVRVFGAVDRWALADVLAVLHDGNVESRTSADAEAAAC